MARPPKTTTPQDGRDVDLPTAQSKQDQNPLLPNFIEAAALLVFNAVRDRGLVRGSLDSAQMGLDLLLAAWRMPISIQTAFLQLIHTAQQIIALTETRTSIPCAAAEQNLADFNTVKRLLENYLHVSATALALASKCPEEVRPGWENDYSKALRQKLTDQFSKEVIDLLDLVVAQTKHLFEYYQEDPVFAKDAIIFAEIVKRYATSTPGQPYFADFDDPLFLLRTIVGNPAGQLCPAQYSEFKTVCVDTTETETRQKSQTTGREEQERNRYIKDVWLGIRSANVRILREWQDHAWTKDHHTKLKIPPDERFKDQEIWFYINGIATDHYVAQLNAEYLAALFKRRIHILHNETEGFYRDLQECIIGRVQNKFTRTMVDTLQGLMAGVKTPILDKWDEGAMPKVVVIAHSQGTIVIANVVKALFNFSDVKAILRLFLLRKHVPLETREAILAMVEMADGDLQNQLNRLLKQMEVYNFANCSDEFIQKEIPPGSHTFYPAVVEHFVNQHDLVPALAPQERYGFAGTVFEKKDAWGHFLNAHYLSGFKAGHYTSRDRQQVSRLFRYLAPEKQEKQYNQ